jgi:hypothetical protein
MKTIRKSIEINVSKEKIWDALMQDAYTKDWYGIFNPGTYALTDWQLGSKAVFANDSENGIIGRTIIHDPYELLSIEYYGVLNHNNEGFENKETQIFKGAHETYGLSSKEHTTMLNIEVDMSDGLFDIMSKSWDEALLKIKNLAEA